MKQEEIKQLAYIKYSNPHQAEAFIKGFQSCQEQSKESEWISVKDRLPTYDTPVLGFTKDDGISVWDFCSITKKGFKMYSKVNKNLEITHWQELTKPTTPLKG